MTSHVHVLLSVLLLALLAPARAHAHSGPPFPIVSDQAAGPYTISIWTDPDTTDDGTPGGQFWVIVSMRDDSEVPADTQVQVTIRPLSREGPSHEGLATPVDGLVSRQFIALLMDHEGPFVVRAAISSSRGSAVVDSQVDATYDLRPPPVMMAVYLTPFLLLAGFWVKAMLRRRKTTGARQREAGNGRSAPAR
ncbi:MAG TPA: hypothetical protein VF198_15700 [Vicinamibacterales bacterium]